MIINKINAQSMQDAARHISTQAAELANFLAPPGSECRRIISYVAYDVVKPSLEGASRLAHGISGIIKAVIGFKLFFPLIIIGTIVREGALLASILKKESGQTNPQEQTKLQSIAEIGEKTRNLPIQLLRSAWYDVNVAVGASGMKGLVEYSI
jgi:hypothetical protein